MDEPVLDLQDVAYRIGGKALLEGVSLTVRRGRMIGLVGHNGSGKSTLLALMAGHAAPSAGRVHLEGRDVRRWPARARARRIAHLAQTPPPAPGLSVRDLAGLGRYAIHGALGRFSETDRAAVAAALTAVGLTDFADRLVDGLSGGERQRAWIAMLLAQEADCLLLDEPTSALDLAHQVEVLGLLRGLCRARGLAVVAVLHDINMAGRHCDELVALKGGRLIERGAPETVIRPATLQAIYGLPMRVIAHPDGTGLVGVPA